MASEERQLHSRGHRRTAQNSLVVHPPGAVGASTERDSATLPVTVGAVGRSVLARLVDPAHEVEQALVILKLVRDRPVPDRVEHLFWSSAEDGPKLARAIKVDFEGRIADVFEVLLQRENVPHHLGEAMLIGKSDMARVGDE